MPNTYGLSSLVFGVPAISGYCVQTQSVSSKNNVEATVLDENGIIVHRRYDDLQSEVSWEAYVNGGSIPTPGSTMAIDSVTYIVVSCDVKRENKGFKVLNLKGVTSSGISL